MALTSVIFRDINLGSERLITEHHTDVDGVIRVLTYTAALDADTTTLLANHKADLEDQLGEAELEDLING